MNKNSVCCVIITYNIGEKLHKCLKSVYDQVDTVVLVDNGSDLKTIDVLKKLEGEKNIKIIYNKENMGIAQALNRGIKFAIENNFEWILTMDNDSEATHKMVESMLNTYKNLPELLAKEVVSLFPMRIDKAISKDKYIESEIEKNSYEAIKVDMTSGNLLKRECIQKVGYFNEELFIDSVDTDYCFRIIELGYKMITVKNAYLMHSLGNVTKRRLGIKNITYTNHSALRRYYITRNRLYIWKKYKSIAKYEIRRDKFYNFSEIIKILFFEEDKKKKFKMIYKGIKDYKSNCFGRYS